MTTKNQSMSFRISSYQNSILRKNDQFNPFDSWFKNVKSGKYNKELIFKWFDNKTPGVFHLLLDQTFFWFQSSEHASRGRQMAESEVRGCPNPMSWMVLNPLLKFNFLCFLFWVPIMFPGFFTVKAQEMKPEVPKVDTVFSKILDEESLLSLFIANQLNITEENLNLIKSTKDSLHAYLKENKQIITKKDELEYFLDFKLEEQEPEIVISKSISLSPKVQVELLELDINKGEQLILNYEKEKNIISLERIEVLLNKVKISNINKIRSGTPTKFEFTAEKSGKVEIIIRSFGILPQKGNIEISIVKNKPRLKVQKLVETYFKKEIQSQIEKDTLIKTLIDEAVTVNGKINPKGLKFVTKKFDLSSVGEIIGFSLFFYPSPEKENLAFFRKDSLRQDPLEDFTLKELIGKSFTYLPEYRIEANELLLLDESNQPIWSYPAGSSHASWKLSANSKRNYAFLTKRDDTSPKLLQLQINNLTRLYDSEITIKVLVVYLQDFLIDKEKEIQELQEKYMLTLL